MSSSGDRERVLPPPNRPWHPDDDEQWVVAPDGSGISHVVAASAPSGGEAEGAREALVERICEAMCGRGWTAGARLALGEDLRAALREHLPPPAPEAREGDGAALIAAERRRQVAQEGWTHEHDDGHVAGELADAALVYASPRKLYVKSDTTGVIVFHELWPHEWESKALPKTDGHGLDRREVTRINEQTGRVLELTKAGALIAAEIDRLQRAAREDCPHA